MKLTLSNAAKENMKNLLSNKKNKVFKINFKGYSWGGLNLDLVLEEQENSMKIYEQDEIKFVVDKEIDGVVNEIMIDYMNYFFKKGFVLKAR